MSVLMQAVGPNTPLSTYEKNYKKEKWSGDQVMPKDR